MRKENNKTNEVQSHSVQRYHERTCSGRNYAFEGFTGSNKYFTSDRYIELDEDYQRKDNKPVKGYGLEIESQCYNIISDSAYATVLNEIVLKLFPQGLFKLQADGSIRGDANSSAEIITQIMTKEFIRNHYKDFKTMYDFYFPLFRIDCASTGLCGMHCNISLGAFGTTAKVQDEAVRKLFYLINRHYDFMCVMVNRNRQRTGYCARMDYSQAKTMDLTNFYSDHYVCFNLGHYNEGRIEIRLVGGQKNFACFRNTMESIFFLVDRVKTISWADCDDIVKVFEGCNRHVYDRIADNCIRAGVIIREDAYKIKESVDWSVDYRLNN